MRLPAPPRHDARPSETCTPQCCSSGCRGHAASAGKPARVPGGGVSVGFQVAYCPDVCTCGAREMARLMRDATRDHALVQHYERHLTATGRQWVITEAHKRTEAP